MMKLICMSSCSVQLLFVIKHYPKWEPSGIFGRVATLFADHLIFLHLCTVNIGINHDGKEFGFSKLSFEVSAAKSQRCPSVPATGRPSDSSQHLPDSFYSSLQIISKTNPWSLPQHQRLCFFYKPHQISTIESRWIGNERINFINRQ